MNRNEEIDTYTETQEENSLKRSEGVQVESLDNLEKIDYKKNFIITLIFSILSAILFIYCIYLAIMAFIPSSVIKG